jgi:putative dimethyl sulfoxide reductase chaperone
VSPSQTHSGHTGEQSTLPKDKEGIAPEEMSELAAKAGLFGFLGRCLEGEPDSALLDLIRGPMLEGLEQSGVHFSTQFLKAPGELLLSTLNEEFTCLFVAPGSISPYASVFETGRMFQEAADRALAAYERGGMVFQPVHSGEFPDHAGFMLGFYAHLLAREDGCLKAGQLDEAASFKTQREDFMLKEMGTWLSGWCRRARGYAMHEFYEQILSLAEAVVWDEVQTIATRQQLRELSALNQREPVKLDYDADFRKASGL